MIYYLLTISFLLASCKTPDANDSRLKMAQKRGLSFKEFEQGVQDLLKRAQIKNFQDCGEKYGKSIIQLSTKENLAWWKFDKAAKGFKILKSFNREYQRRLKQISYLENIQKNFGTFHLVQVGSCNSYKDFKSIHVFKGIDKSKPIKFSELKKNSIVPIQKLQQVKDIPKLILENEAGKEVILSQPDLSGYYAILPDGFWPLSGPKSDTRVVLGPANSNQKLDFVVGDLVTEGGFNLIYDIKPQPGLENHIFRVKMLVKDGQKIDTNHQKVIATYQKLENWCKVQNPPNFCKHLELPTHFGWFLHDSLPIHYFGEVYRKIDDRFKEIIENEIILTQLDGTYIQSKTRVEWLNQLVSQILKSLVEIRETKKRNHMDVKIDNILLDGKLLKLIDLENLNYQCDIIDLRIHQIDYSPVIKTVSPDGILNLCDADLESFADLMITILAPEMRDGLVTAIFIENSVKKGIETYFSNRPKGTKATFDANLDKAGIKTFFYTTLYLLDPDKQVRFATADNLIEHAINGTPLKSLE